MRNTEYRQAAKVYPKVSLSRAAGFSETWRCWVLMRASLKLKLIHVCKDLGSHRERKALSE